MRRRGHPMTLRSCSCRERPRTRCRRPTATCDRAGRPPPRTSDRRRSRRSPLRPCRTRSRRCRADSPPPSNSRSCTSPDTSRRCTCGWSRRAPSCTSCRRRLGRRRPGSRCRARRCRRRNSRGTCWDRTAPCRRPTYTSTSASRISHAFADAPHASEASPFSHLSSRQQPVQFAGVHVTTCGLPSGPTGAWASS